MCAGAMSTYTRQPGDSLSTQSYTHNNTKEFTSLPSISSHRKSKISKKNNKLKQASSSSSSSDSSSSSSDSDSEGSSSSMSLSPSLSLSHTRTHSLKTQLNHLKNTSETATLKTSKQL